MRNNLTSPHSASSRIFLATIQTPLAPPRCCYCASTNHASRKSLIQQARLFFMTIAPTAVKLSRTTTTDVRRISPYPHTQTRTLSRNFVVLPRTYQQRLQPPTQRNIRLHSVRLFAFSLLYPLFLSLAASARQTAAERREQSSSTVEASQASATRRELNRAQYQH